jgi:hypothetical protein
MFVHIQDAEKLLQDALLLLGTKDPMILIGKSIIRM